MILTVLFQGSLEDLLLNETVKLGWDFKFSILKDICRGMEFLHRSDIGSHGRLKSSNCVVDNRWTCKISGKCEKSVCCKFEIVKTLAWCCWVS